VFNVDDLGAWPGGKVSFGLHFIELLFSECRLLVECCTQTNDSKQVKPRRDDSDNAPFVTSVNSMVDIMSWQK